MICRHFGVCGGCSLPGVPYAAQLAAKQELMRQWFPAARCAPIVASPREAGFRQKVSFVFTPDSASRRIVMGHFRAQSTRVVPVDECPVHSDRGNRLAFTLRDRLSAGRVPAGVLRHVLVRTTADEGEASLMLVATENHLSLRAPVRALLGSPEAPDGCFINIHDRPGPHMVGPRTIHLAGRSHVREQMLGTSFLISPTAFFQTNVGAARGLLQIVLDEVGAAGRVLDLYSGVGLFAIPLARQGAQVVAVEENRQAVDDCHANLRFNRVRDRAVRLVASRAERVLSGPMRESFDVVVLDPPRLGCPDRVIDAVTALRASRLVYVSCNPERLARETPRFARAGYRLTRIRPVDMFPHTEHVEAVAVFEPSPTGKRTR